MRNKNVFDRFVDWLDNMENSFVNLISKVIPILVPLIPAYVSYNHVRNELGFSDFFAFTYASVVEGLGYASIYKALQFWEWNRRFSKDEKKSPFTLAIIIYITYIFVILWVNVMLDWQTGVVWYRIVAVGAISLLSVPAGLLVSISAMHNERVKEHEEVTEQLREARHEAKRQKEEEKAEKERKAQEIKNERENKSQDSQFKKLSKSEQAYEFVRNYYLKNNNLPTNKIVSDSTGLALGTAFSAIESFVFDNAEELISKGLVSQEKVDKIRKSKGIVTISVPEWIENWIVQNNKFPDRIDIESAGISMMEVAKWVSLNQDRIREAGILDEDSIQGAIKVLQG